MLPNTGISINQPFEKMEEIITLFHFKPISSFHAAWQALNDYINEELEKAEMIRTKSPLGKMTRNKPPKGDNY